jgi:predicted peptidase
MEDNRMKTFVRTLAITLGIIATAGLYAQGPAPQRPEPFAREKKLQKDLELEQQVFRKGEDKLNYNQHLYNRDEKGKPAILIFLHGIGERGDDNLAQNRLAVTEIVKNIRDNKRKVLLITCQCPSSELWAPLHRGGAAAALQPLPSKCTGLIPDLVEAKIKEIDADPDRVYITGQSMGGYGTWDIICRRPDLFAAAVPVCGGGDPKQAPVLKEMAIWIYHGDKDTLVPTVLSREMIKALQDAGSKRAKYKECPGVEHNCWETTYNDPEMYKWLFEQKRTKESAAAKPHKFTEEEIKAAEARRGGMPR